MSGDPNAFSQHRRAIHCRETCPRHAPDTSTTRPRRRAIHYREHFMTNVATAGATPRPRVQPLGATRARPHGAWFAPIGGLLLLVKLGGGRYTVDELVKKKD